MTCYKIVTYDLRPPLQRGEPIWDGKTLPYILPKTELDESDKECAKGWNYVTDLAEGFKITGLWPDSRPSRVLIVEPDGSAISRGTKHRARSLTILREATVSEVEQGITDLSCIFAPHTDEMTREQIAWRNALSRPRRDEEQIQVGLIRALKVRGLKDWSLRRFKDARASRAAWAAWASRDTCAASNARDARASWNAYAARDAWNAWTTWTGWKAWNAWTTWTARNAWDGWDAGVAVIVYFAARKGWTTQQPHVLSAGLRDAYEAGLEVAMPVGPTILGWAKTE